MDKPTTNFMLDVLKCNPDFFVGMFDYSKVHFIQDDVPVTLGCPRHGDFEASPKSILKTLELCPNCISARKWSVNRSTLPEFVSKAKSVHGDKYDYSLITEYVNAKTKVPIRCHKCAAIFHQRPYQHLEGKGCKHCKFDNLKDSQGYLYIMAKASSCYKIGISNNPERRLYHLLRDTPFKLRPVRKFQCGTWSQASEIETELHLAYSSRNSGFKGFHGCTEWFSLTPLQVQEVFRLLESRGFRAESFI